MLGSHNPAVSKTDYKDATLPEDNEFEKCKFAKQPS